MSFKADVDALGFGRMSDGSSHVVAYIHKNGEAVVAGERWEGDGMLEEEESGGGSGIWDVSSRVCVTEMV